MTLCLFAVNKVKALGLSQAVNASADKASNDLLRPGMVVRLTVLGLVVLVSCATPVLVAMREESNGARTLRGLEGSSATKHLVRQLSLVLVRAVVVVDGVIVVLAEETHVNQVQGLRRRGGRAGMVVKRTKQRCGSPFMLLEGGAGPSCPPPPRERGGYP